MRVRLMFARYVPQAADIENGGGEMLGIKALGANGYRSSVRNLTQFQKVAVHREAEGEVVDGFMVYEIVHFAGKRELEEGILLLRFGIRPRQQQHRMEAARFLIRHWWRGEGYGMWRRDRLRQMQLFPLLVEIPISEEEHIGFFQRLGFTIEDFIERGVGGLYLMVYRPASGGSSDAGLEELPSELARVIRAGDPGDPIVRAVVPDRMGIPQVAVAQRVFVKVPGAAEISVRPVVLVQRGLLDEKILREFERRGWIVETLAQEEMTPMRLSGRVKNAALEWDRPILVLVGTEYEDLAKGLPVYGRVTGIVLDVGFAAVLGPSRLFRYISETLAHYPGRILRVEYEVQLGRDSTYYVSTQL